MELQTTEGKGPVDEDGDSQSGSRVGPDTCNPV